MALDEIDGYSMSTYFWYVAPYTNIFDHFAIFTAIFDHFDTFSDNFAHLDNPLFK